MKLSIGRYLLLAAALLPPSCSDPNQARTARLLPGSVRAGGTEQHGARLRPVAEANPLVHDQLEVAHDGRGVGDLQTQAPRRACNSLWRPTVSPAKEQPTCSELTALPNGGSHIMMIKAIRT